MHKSRILTKSGILILSCDREGCLTWTPAFNKLVAAVNELPESHPARVALTEMQDEKLLDLVLPHKDELEQLEIKTWKSPSLD